MPSTASMACSMPSATWSMVVSTMAGTVPNDGRNINR